MSHQQRGYADTAPWLSTPGGRLREDLRSGLSCRSRSGPGRGPAAGCRGSCAGDRRRADRGRLRGRPEAWQQQTCFTARPLCLAIRVCTFPPDSETYASYAASIAESFGPEAVPGGESTIPGMHQTDTVDVVTVVSGELCIVTENGEAVLRPGDSIVQRGTPHARSNRTEETVTVAAIMMAATR